MVNFSPNEVEEKKTINGKHAQHILEEFIEDHSLRDVTFCIHGEELSVHKVVLAAVSDYFYAMFADNMDETKEKYIPFIDTDMSTFRKIVDYIYYGTIVLTDDTAESILRAAVLFKLQAVIDECNDYYKKKLMLNNCISILVMADQLDLTDLKLTVLDFVNENFLNLFQRDDFMEINIEQLLLILNSQNVAVEAEEQIFLCIKGWVDFKKSEREIYLFQLLELIKFPLLTPMFIDNQIINYCKSSYECMALVIGASKARLIPYTSLSLPSPRPLPKYSLEKVVVVGNFNREKLDIKRLDPIINSWSYCTSSNIRKNEFGVAAIEDGKIIILGGLVRGASTDTVECINLKTTCSFEFSPMLKKCHSFEAISIGTGNALNVYVVGGKEGKKTLNTVQKWSSSLECWSLVASMKYKRERFALAVLNNKLYAAGGLCDFNTLHNVEVYNQESNKWLECPSMNEKRHSFGMAAGQDCLYAIGGINGDGEKLSTVEEYNPKSRRWNFVNSMPSGYEEVRAVGLTNGNLIVFGGSNNHLEVLQYLPDTNEWKQMAPINNVYNNLKAVHMI